MSQSELLPPSEAVVLVAELEQDGIELSLRGTQIYYQSPRGRLSRERKERLKAAKAEVISLLRTRADCALVLPQAPHAEATWEPHGHHASMVFDADVGCIPCVHLCQSAFDTSAAHSALDALLARHSLLRSYHTRDTSGRLFVVTMHRMPVPMSVVDLRLRDRSARETAVLDILSSKPPIDLFTGPPLSCTAIQLSDDACLLIAFVHHCVCDAVSQVLISRDLGELYLSAQSETPAALAPPPMEYRDFVRERSRWLTSGAAKFHIQYWRRVIAGPPSIFQLPYDRRVAPGPHYRRPNISGGIGSETLERLRAIALRCRTTIAVVACSLFSCLLSRWSGHTDAAAWICHTGRNRPELYDVVGCFIDHWLLRTNLDGNPTFEAVLGRVHQHFVEAVPHIDVTLHHLIPEMLRLNDGATRPCVVLNVLPFSGPAGKDYLGRLGERLPDAVRSLSANSPIAFVLNFLEGERDLCWNFTHNSYLFEESTIQALSDALARIAMEVCNAPARRLADLNIGLVRASEEPGAAVS